jgi:hypothetical protein
MPTRVTLEDPLGIYDDGPWILLQMEGNKRDMMSHPSKTHLMLESAPISRHIHSTDNEIRKSVSGSGISLSWLRFGAFSVATACNFCHRRILLVVSIMAHDLICSQLGIDIVAHQDASRSITFTFRQRVYSNVPFFHFPFFSFSNPKRHTPTVRFSSHSSNS